eukprot:106916-Hanusia_phi.AAC.1
MAERNHSDPALYALQPGLKQHLPSLLAIAPCHRSLARMLMMTPMMGREWQTRPDSGDDHLNGSATGGGYRRRLQEETKVD